MSGALRRLLNVRAAEAGVALRLLALMVALWIGAGIGANAIESLLFVRVGPHLLPYLYVGLGVLTFLVMVGVNAVLGRLPPERFVVLVPLILAVAVGAMRVLLLSSARWIYPALWLAMMVVWTVQLLTAWTLAGMVHDTRQAKRLFPLYGSGLIVGGVVGGLATGPLARLLGAENLPLLWVGSLVLNVMLARSVLRVAGVGRRRRRRRAGDVGRLLEQLGEGWRVVRGSGLLRWMSVALSLFALLYFSLSLLFAQAATARFPDEEELAGFLGLFMGASSGAALLASLFLANRLFARFGVPAMVLVLPAVYLVGFGSLVVATTFAGLVAFRFVQMTWVNGIWATGWQALFNVVPARQRDRVRTFMDGVPLQSGVIASGVVLILAQRVLPPRQVALIGALAAALATVAMWRARRAYPAAVVEALRVGDPEVFVAQADPFGGAMVDAEARSVLVERSSDPDPATRRISMEILAEAGPSEAMEAVRRGLGDEDAAVRAAAVRAASGLDGALASDVRALLADPDPSVRAAAVRSVADGGDPPDGALLARLSDTDPVVRAQAARAVLRGGNPDEAEEVLRAMLSDHRPEWREAALDASRGTDLGSRASLDALGDPDAAVRSAAVAELRQWPRPGAVDALASLLADPSPAVREGAALALVGTGADGRERLLAALEDPARESAALAALVDAEGPDAGAVRRVGQRHAGEAMRFGRFLRDLGGAEDERLDLLARALRYHAFRHAVVALRAVSGATDPASMRPAIEGLTAWDPAQRATALEALEVVGDASAVRPLVSLWDLEPGTGGRRREAALVELMEDPDPWLRACAAMAARPARTDAVRAALARSATSDADTLVRQAATWSLEGGEGLEAIPGVSLMERVLFLRKVPLFADLDPPDLKAVAEAVTEQAFSSGEVIATEGEPGEELYILTEGEIRVVVGAAGGPGREVARRGPGEYVGEMAVISREPRMASLVCSGPVRVLALDRARFERILRERPDASLAMMRVLAARLRESDTGAGGR
jgi:HEAT repeat protein